jgi:hypothetical protein
MMNEQQVYWSQDLFTMFKIAVKWRGKMLITTFPWFNTLILKTIITEILTVNYVMYLDYIWQLTCD